MGYDRELFGGGWIDADHNGCDTRCEVLAGERRFDLGVDGGGWVSIYDDVVTADVSVLEVDHVVALAEAWDSGAAGWEVTRRVAFANDLDYPGALVAVTGSSNRAKSDHDPAEWLPAARSGRCAFAIAWTTTKLRWDLTADEVEVIALNELVTAHQC